MKIRLVRNNIVPGQVMRVRKVVAAFVKIHFALFMLKCTEVMKYKYLDRYRDGQCPIDEQFPIFHDLLQRPLVFYHPEYVRRYLCAVLAFGAIPAQACTQPVKFDIIIGGIVVKSYKKFYAAISVHRVVNMLISRQHFFFGHIILNINMIAAMSYSECNPGLIRVCGPGNKIDSVMLVIEYP